MALTQGCSAPVRLHLVHAWARQVELAAPHSHRHIQATGSDSYHPHAAARRRVTIGTQQGGARFAETLQVHLMANTIARLREHHPVLGRNALQVLVVVCVLETDLYRVVVHVADREIGAHPFQAKGLELQVGHGAGGVLGQGLVYPDAYLAAGAPRTDD